MLAIIAKFIEFVVRRLSICQAEQNASNYHVKHEPDTAPDILLTQESQPISVANPGHWKVHEETRQLVRNAPNLFMPNGSVIDVEKNDLGEWICCVPKVARPSRTLQQNTKRPGSFKWNLILGCWIDSDNNSSRGSWGYLKDEKQPNRRSLSDEAENRGLLTSNGLSAAVPITTKSNQAKCHANKRRHHSTRRPLIPADSGCRKPLRADSNMFMLDEPSELAAENEIAIESYNDPLEDSSTKEWSWLEF